MCPAQKTPKSKTFKICISEVATEAKKNIRRCMPHEISYEAWVSWVLFSFVNNEIFSNLLGP